MLSSHRLADLKDRIRTKGLRLTPQRETVLKVLLDNGHRHLSAEEIQKASEESKRLGLATVYRTLRLLSDIGAVRSTDFGDGKARYEIADPSAHHHQHLICLNCGRVDEVECDLLQQIENQLETRYDFKVFDHVLKVYGLCKSCREKKASR